MFSREVTLRTFKNIDRFVIPLKSNPKDLFESSFGYRTHFFKA